jgi:hypothetical protein
MNLEKKIQIKALPEAFESLINCYDCVTIP